MTEPFVVASVKLRGVAAERVANLRKETFDGGKRGLGF
jgi:hypothetical protein